MNRWPERRRCSPRRCARAESASSPSSCEAYAAFRELSPRPASWSSRLNGRRPDAVEGTNLVLGVALGRKHHDPSRLRPPPPVVVKLRRVTDGMSQNTAMAVCAAMRLGVPRKEIERRLLSWNPAPLRGNGGFPDGRRLYLDCYNANPASMSDALASFNAMAPSDEPRLLVLGCMEELGPNAATTLSWAGRSSSGPATSWRRLKQPCGRHPTRSPRDGRRGESDRDCRHYRAHLSSAFRV